MNRSGSDKGAVKGGRTVVPRTFEFFRKSATITQLKERTRERVEDGQRQVSKVGEGETATHVSAASARTFSRSWHAPPPLIEFRASSTLRNEEEDGLGKFACVQYNVRRIAPRSSGYLRMTMTLTRRLRRWSRQFEGTGRYLRARDRRRR